ncbi:glycosyltransferase [Tanticharoenia sakaeratensis]|uniref:Glycosyl transferase n=1 Tax=Tanticharoenia sakaeratensis NBRC 103193 TaxID=1231623 RepID=A0A0D6MJ01_9PROT|nr:glycosyltransferase [Tanticharoenia sakaeratensis]GAN53466.1 glycosyl transferase [Tanticharoenia sakaeratensis NBRC 103193]GBQ17783.1 glycosyltransferase [Tanticharoenia sakaeratensis NBRC 103193]
MTDILMPHQSRHGTNEARWLRPDAGWARVHHAEILAREAPDAIHDDVALAAFFRTRGNELGLVPNRLFDEGWYLAANPDVAAGVREGIFASGFQHYCESGFRSRAPHWLFSEQDYFTRNPDLTPHALDERGFHNGYDHFLKVGDREGRIGHQFFDPLVFRADALAAHSGIDLDRGLFAQYLASPQTTRTSWYFDPAWYLETYPQVRQAIEQGEYSGPLHHYLTNGTPQAFDPNPFFSEASYASRYPDVDAIVRSGGFRNGFEHFRKFGAREGRDPGNIENFGAYRSRPDVVRDLQIGRAPDAFAHFVAARTLRGVDVDHAPETLRGPFAPELCRALAYRRAESLLPLVARAPLDFRTFGLPRLSVVITARNGFLWTLAALAALRDCTRAPIELILIDDGSTDGTTTIERLVDGLTVIRPEHRMTLPARLTLGLSRVRAPAVLLLDQAIQLRLGAVDVALSHLGQADVAAVTGRVTALDMTVIEAGLTVYRDGNLERIGAGSSIETPEIGFVRDCDAGSAGALFVQTARLRDVGLDPEARSMGALLISLSLSLRQAGGRVVYDPAMLARSIGMTPEAQDARESARMQRRDRFRTLLRGQPAGAPFMSARAGADADRPRVLVLCDRVPMPEQGRDTAILVARIAMLGQAGCRVTLYPLDDRMPDASGLALTFGDDVEILRGAGAAGLAALLDGRRLGFDRIWIAGTRVLGQCLFVFHQMAHTLPTQGFVLDVSALRSVEHRGRRRLGGIHDHEALMADLRQELQDAWFCQGIVASNDEEASLIRQAGFDNVHVLAYTPGGAHEPVPSVGYASRRDVLCLPFIGAGGDAAHDGVDWFVHTVVPMLDQHLPPEVTIDIAGRRPDTVDLSPLARYRRVRLVSPDVTMNELVRTRRVLVVPDRFSAGLASEVLCAAAAGLPAVLSDDIALRLGWRDGDACLAGGVGDAARLADAIGRLYGDSDLWTRLSLAARDAAGSRYGAASALSQLRVILAEAGGKPAAATVSQSAPILDETLS